MSGADAVGDVVLGAIAAGAVEPDHGADEADHTHEADCLNCGTALIGSHCHACGQAAHVHRTLAAFFHDLLHGVFHFEGKIWRTLPLLVWRPGRLTREYIEGRRASYVSPIALFLFVVFLSFAVFNALGNPIDLNPQTPQEAAASIAAARVDLAELRREQANAIAKGDEIPGIEGRIAGLEEALQELESQDDDAPIDVNVGSGPYTGPQWAKGINQAWKRAAKNPELAIYKFQNSAYKFSWLLIPISVPFVWLLFPFSRAFRMYDHTVFVTYSLCFMLLLTAGISLAVIGNWMWLVPLLLVYAPFHMYRQLRDAYALSRFGAWWRTWFLSIFALLALVLFAVVITMLSASG